MADTTVAGTIKKSAFGNKRVEMGRFASSAPDTIVTSLDVIEFATVTGASAITASGGTLTVTTAATAGFWLVVGY